MKDVCALARKAGGSGVHLSLFQTRKIKTGGLRLPLHFGGPAFDHCEHFCCNGNLFFRRFPISKK